MKRYLTISGLTLLTTAAVGACSSAPRSGENGTVRSITEPLTLATSPRCSVELDKLSYDDPGSDDGELLELVVTHNAGFDPSQIGEPPPATCGADGGHDSSGAALSLGDCGLEAIELLNGGGTECSAYRTIPVGEVPVPADGRLLVCAEDSTWHGAVGCDVTTAGRASLKNGWLQNGPSDGMRFVGADGQTLREVAYEGADGVCFSAAVVSAVDETGVMDVAGVEEDDVNLWCGAGFSLVPASEAMPGSPGKCPGPSVVRDGDAGPLHDGAVIHATDEDAADGDPITGLDERGTVETVETVAVEIDAPAATSLSDGSAPSPDPVTRGTPASTGCSLATRGASPSAAPGMSPSRASSWCAIAAALVIGLRRRRPGAQAT